MMNVEADITVGRILNWYAAQKGVLYALAYQVYKDVYPTLIALQRKITE